MAKRALTRHEELVLIDLGLKHLIQAAVGDVNGHVARKRVPWNKGKTKKTGAHKWSAAQRKHFAATMKKKWAEKKAAEK